MTLFLFIFALLMMAAVAVVLGLGIYSLFRGGEFNTKWSNKLMRLRVLLQAIALILLVALAWAFHSGH